MAGKCIWQVTADVWCRPCSAASADLVEKSQAAQKLLKVVIAGLSEDAHSEEVRKVCTHPAFVASSVSCVASICRRTHRYDMLPLSLPQACMPFFQLTTC